MAIQKKEVLAEEVRKVEIKESHDQIKLIMTERKKLGVNPKAMQNSIKHHLNVDRLSQCEDVTKLSEYYIHLQAKLKTEKEEK